LFGNFFETLTVLQQSFFKKETALVHIFILLANEHKLKWNKVDVN